MDTPSTAVSPGLGGFLAFFLLALALWLLMRNMNTRLRNLGYREEREAERVADSAAASQHAEPGSGTPSDAAVGQDPGQEPKQEPGRSPQQEHAPDAGDADPGATPRG